MRGLFGDAMLRISRDLTIDENDIDISFVRASGPGGQNVNKLSTAAQLRFDTRRITLAPDVAARLNRLAGQRMTKDGVIVIHGQRFRTQERNRADVIDRLVELLREAWCGPPRGGRPGRRWDRNSAGSKARSAAATSSPSAARRDSTIEAALPQRGVHDAAALVPAKTARYYHRLFATT